MAHSKPRDEEIDLDPKRYIISETDAEGKLLFCNDYFLEVAGFSRDEMIGQSHNMIRHPDMPKVVFKLLWETISQGKNINCVIKNLAKDGRYYWVFTEFESEKDESGNIVAYRAHRKNVSKHIKEVVADLYAQLLEVEKDEGMEASQNYLENLLKEKGEEINFINLMENIHRFY